MQFAGEFRHIDSLLKKLSETIAQTALSEDIVENIKCELDTQNLLATLTVQVEDAIRFLGSAQVGDISGEMTLEAFVLTQLQVARSAWEQGSTRAVRQHVQLKHLAALYRRLEEQTTGKSWLSDVPPAYKVVLSVEMDGALRQAVPQLTDGEGLLANLRQLLEGRYPPAGNLREMLEAVDVEDAALVPDTLKLEHAGSVYVLLESLS